MKGKTIQILLLVTIVLGGIWLAQNKLINKSSNENSGVVKFDPDGSMNDVKRIVVQKGEDSIGMTLKDGIWFLETDKPLGEDRAIQGDADKLAKVLDGINVEIVSQNVDKHASLGIDDSSANSISYYKENESSPFLILKFSNKNSANFRQTDKTNVYSWDSSIARILDKDAKSWLEPTPMPTPTVSVENDVNSSQK